MYRPVESDHSGDWHMEKFAEFDRLKAALGEPTPHMEVVRLLSEGEKRSELLWRAGAYCAGYSVLTAEAIWREWPYQRMLKERHNLGPWIRDNWPGIHTRTPRRCVRTAEAFERCLLGYFDWMHTVPDLRAIKFDNPVAEYNTWWSSATRIPFFGRYISIRLLELLRRWDFMTAELYDIRAMEAESPIRCLSLLVPEQAPALLAGDRAVADATAGAVLAEASSDRRYFRFAALLCEYRKSYEEGHDYPGNQTDEELGYQYGRHAEHWTSRGHTTGLWGARAVLVPAVARGEDRGWTGQRPLAGAALRQHGVNWSDALFDYAASLAAGRPVAWT